MVRHEIIHSNDPLEVKIYDLLSFSIDLELKTSVVEKLVKELTNNLDSQQIKRILEVL